MPPSGKFRGTNISRSDVTVATSLPTYYCLCGEYVLVGNVQLNQLARRPEDKSYVLRNVASEEYGGKHVYKLNAISDKEAVYVRQKMEDGTDGLEKRWRKRCPRCELEVAYETSDPRDKKLGPYTFIRAGALSDEQTAIPSDAFGDAGEQL